MKKCEDLKDIDLKPIAKDISLCVNKMCTKKCKRYYEFWRPSERQSYIQPTNECDALGNFKLCKMRYKEDQFMELEEKLKKSVIYKFNDCDTVYIPKGYTLQEAIDWYSKEYDEIDIDNEEFSEVDYTEGFWDPDVPKDVADRIYKDNPSNFDQYNLDKNKKVKEGTIEYRFGDLFIWKTFKTAKEENDKLDADIFVICSTF